MILSIVELFTFLDFLVVVWRVFVIQQLLEMLELLEDVAHILALV